MCPLVTGDIPGVAVVLGKAEKAEDVAAVVKGYQSKGIMTFLVGDVIEQCAEQGVKMGLELRVIPLGHDVTAVIHVVTVAIRAALIFGNVQPGDLAGLLAYTKERVPAFVNTFGDIDPVVVSAGAGAIALGFPVVVDVDLGENQVPGALESCTDHSETVKKSLELRGIKIKSKELPIPVAFAAAFEGEIIRKADMQVEFWSAKNTTCELVQMQDASDRSRITRSPSTARTSTPATSNTPLPPAFTSRARRCRPISSLSSSVRSTPGSTIWKVSCTPASATSSASVFPRTPMSTGLRLHHFGEVLYHMIMDEFDAVVDKCEVRLHHRPGEGHEVPERSRHAALQRA